MGDSFFKSFQRGPALIADPDVRNLLHRAILDGDQESFRATLERHAPETASTRALYGVLVLTADGMRPFAVNERGEPIRAGYVIAAGTPIELLNVDFESSRMTATDLDGNVWTTAISED